jgi:hypothetical protein
MGKRALTSSAAKTRPNKQTIERIVNFIIKFLI